MSDTPFTLERMQADVAEMLGVPVSEVGADEYLLDLGVDSMQIMQLADQWSRASGVSVGFADLAEQPMLRGWWDVISGRMG